MRRLYQDMRSFGLDPQQMLRAVRGLGPTILQDRQYRRQAVAKSGATFPVRRRFYIFGEGSESGGTAKGHYFHQDLVVARDIFSRAPRRHIDVGSSIYGFVSHVASFREIEVIDIRPIPEEIAGISFHQADIMDAGKLQGMTADSVSCLHALEHMGLGRYGDPLDYDGWRVALANLMSMVEPGGMLYLSVPTGVEQRTEFNAHRVFRVQTILDEIASDFEVEWAHFVDDEGSLHPNFDFTSPKGQNAFNCRYGLSIWGLRKSLGTI